jgi:serine/threonine protein kinase HipA of HipAB toxin-antitoxin module
MSLTIPAKGVGGSWIVKLPSLRFEGIPENEFAMMTLARLVGIEVPEIKLVDIGSIGNLPDGIGDLRGQAFAIARFDRTPAGAVHTEDFAQVFAICRNRAGRRYRIYQAVNVQYSYRQRRYASEELVTYLSGSTDTSSFSGL